MNKHISLVYWLMLVGVSLESHAETAIAQMLDVYSRNQARFYQDYKGKTYRADAVVTSVVAESSVERSMNASMGLKPMFGVGLSVNNSSAMCSISDKTVAANLDRGQRVRFSGVVTEVGFDGRTLLFSDCEIVPTRAKK